MRRARPGSTRSPTRVSDFDPIFADLSKVSDDDPGILYSPDDYATPSSPVAGKLVADAREAASNGRTTQARDLFLRAAAVYRIARFPINRSPLSQDAWENGKAAYEQGGLLLNPRASRSTSRSRTPTHPQAISTPP